MALIALLLIGFVILGLNRERLGWASYALMGMMVLTFVAYSFHHTA